MRPRLEFNALSAILDRLRVSLDRLGGLLNVAAGWLFIVCSLFVTFDVVGRKFFGISSKATVELTGYMLALGIAWGLTEALTSRAHIRVDVLVSKMPLGVRAWMHALALTFLGVLGFFLSWRAWAVVQDSWDFNTHDSSALSVPLAYPQGAWALGITLFFALTLVMWLEVLVLLALGRSDVIDRLLGPRTLQEEASEALEAAHMSDVEAGAKS
jgi:TRAP-type C4-dicarboxylate transport system permease small subunit